VSGTRATLLALVAASFGCGSDPAPSDALDLGGLTVDSSMALVPDAAMPVGPYPIILVHGLSGFAKLGPFEYFAGVPAALTAAGRKVYTPSLDMFNGSDARGQKLVDEIAAVRLETGAAKVVLVAHSQGGLDSRWAAAHAPESIAAVVTIATPHRGSKIADVALGLTPGPAQDAASAALALLGGALDPGGMPDANLHAALETLSTAGAAAFNAAVPDAASVLYYSIAGRSFGKGSSSCPPSTAPFVAAWDAQNDPLDVALWSSGGIIAAAELPGTPDQDGLVTVPSAQWGEFLGCIPADHENEICQPLTGPGLGNGFDCIAFYRGLESFLRDKGL
jgi:triacylglycerol lipase